MSRYIESSTGKLHIVRPDNSLLQKGSSDVTCFCGYSSDEPSIIYECRADTPDVETCKSCQSISPENLKCSFPGCDNKTINRNEDGTHINYTASDAYCSECQSKVYTHEEYEEAHE